MLQSTKYLLSLTKIRPLQSMLQSTFYQNDFKLLSILSK
jgi:hypothetical protein